MWCVCVLNHLSQRVFKPNFCYCPKITDSLLSAANAAKAWGRVAWEAADVSPQAKLFFTSQMAGQEVWSLITVAGLTQVWLKLENHDECSQHCGVLQKTKSLEQEWTNEQADTCTPSSSSASQRWDGYSCSFFFCFRWIDLSSFKSSRH